MTTSKKINRAIKLSLVGTVLATSGFIYSILDFPSSENKPSIIAKADSIGTILNRQIQWAHITHNPLEITTEYQTIKEQYATIINNPNYIKIKTDYEEKERKKAQQGLFLTIPLGILVIGGAVSALYNTHRLINEYTGST